MFNKKIEQDCRWCRFGYVTVDRDTCMCDKYGVIAIPQKCRKFRYDPLKRIPEQSAEINTEYTEEDFAIDLKSSAIE